MLWVKIFGGSGLRLMEVTWVKMVEGSGLRLIEVTWVKTVDLFVCLI